MGIQETASTITREYIGQVNMDNAQYNAHVVYVHDFDNHQVNVEKMDIEVLDGCFARLEERGFKAVEKMILDGELFDEQ